MAVANQKLGNYYYTRDPDKAIVHFNKAYQNMSAIGDVNNAIFCLQNIAFTYEEQKRDLANAEKYAQMAIDERKERKDTLQLANMLKYIGYIQGKAGKYAEAKENVKKGIELFSAKRYHQGVAVCYYDFGKVYEYESKLDSALYYFNESKKIWTDLKEQEKRIFNVNNALMHVYTLKDNLAEASKLYRENLAIMGKEYIYWNDKLNFYKSSAALLAKQKDTKQSESYNTQYMHTKDSLTKAGIWIAE